MFAPPPLPRTLPAAFRDLTSERPETRASAMADLARHAQGDPAVRAKALPCLERALREDEHAQVRAAAAVALADLAASEALPSLLLAVEDPDLHVRQMALNGLGEIGDPRATPRVERALEHPRPEVRYQALIAFAKLAAEPRDANVALARALGDDDPAIRYIAVRLLEERVEAPAGLEPPMLARLRQFAGSELSPGDANRDVALAAAILLAKGGDLAGKARLLEVVSGRGALGSAREKEDEQEAVELVGRLGLREAVPALERRAYGAGRWVRDTCTFHARIALARLGHPRAVREIVSELDSPRESVRAGAVVAAGRAALGEAKPLIEQLLARRRVDPALAAEALRALGSAPPSCGAFPPRPPFDEGRLSLLSEGHLPYRSPMHSAGEARDAGVRYAPPQPGGHVEAYVLQASDPVTRSALYVEASIFASQRPPYRALAAALAVFFDREKGHVAVRAQVPFDVTGFGRDTLDVRVSHQGHAPLLVLGRDGSRGEVSSGERTVGWDLALARRGASLPLLDRRLSSLTRLAVRSTGRANLVLVAPDLRVSGTVTVNGVARDVSHWSGFLAHGWSPSTPRTFAWGHCSAWENAGGAVSGAASELVLQGLSVRRAPFTPLASFVPLPSLGRPMTLLSLRYRGQDHLVQSPLEVVAARAEISPRRWKFQGRAGLLTVEGELWAETDDFVGLFAQNPNGTMGHLLVSALARARVSVTPRGGTPFLARSKAATLILGTSEPHHGVRMYV